MKIYTRTGDKGETSLYTGQRIPKNDPLFEAIGTVDELSCAIGLAASFLNSVSEIAQITQLETIQNALFDVGAALATPRTRASSAKVERTRFDSEETQLLELWIDQMESELPALKTFILPGGHPAGASLHLARSICRRAERLVVPLNHRADVPNSILVYLNRLSDFLFVLARLVNQRMQVPEKLWEPHKH